MKVKRIGLEPKFRESRDYKRKSVDLNKAIDAMKVALPGLLLLAVAGLVCRALENRSIGSEERMMMAAEMPQPLA